MSTYLNNNQPTIDNNLFSFVNFLKVVEYITLDNQDSIQSEFFNLKPGQALGIDVDYVQFSNTIELTRGDYLLKQQNEQPLHIKGPANGYYRPYLSKDNNNNYFLNYEFISNRPDIETQEVKSVAIGEKPGQNYKNYKYQISMNTSDPQCYSIHKEINSKGSITFRKISNIDPIIKTYYGIGQTLEEIYINNDKITLSLNDGTYTLRNNTSLAIIIEVR